MAKKSTKSALLTSVVALFLCFTMLVGTTFAWFTDSVTSANNIIKSGNLDVEFEYWNGTEWVDVSGKTDILTNTLWEPGVTEVAYLKVTNNGSLALKYQMGINIVSETLGKNVANEDLKLSDYLNFGVVEGVDGETNAYGDRDAAVAAVTDAKSLNIEYIKNEDITKEETEQEHYFALVVWMPTTVGNEANHNGTDIPQIDLGLKLFATQFTAEDDTFGPDYDEGAPIAWDGKVDTTWFDNTATELTISNGAQLAGLATLKNQLGGKTITLDADINLDGQNWTPINIFTPGNSFTFDGGNHTIYNLKINGGSDKGLFDNSTGTIKNLKIVNAEITSSGRSAVVTGRHYGDIINCHVKNATVNDSYWAVGGIVGLLNSGNIKNCSVTNVNIKSNGGVGGIVGVINETAGTRNVENCSVIGGTINNIGAYGSAYTGGGVVGLINISNSTVNITGCSSTATLEGEYIYEICPPADADITLNIN